VKTVLVVDDDREIRESLKEFIEAFGYDVLVCESGEHAVLLIYKADALITDFNMQGMNGIELAKRAESQKPDMPVLLMTGNPEQVPSMIPYEVVEKPFIHVPISSWLRRKITE